jgi:CheY-like chemotaxis protein
VNNQVIPCVILYAEDEENDIVFFKHALKTLNLAHQLQSVLDGEGAVDYLAGKGSFANRERFPFPDLVLLDINMPKRSGLEVLEWIRLQPKFKSLPVLILTSSSRDEDKHKALQLGADDFLLKPSDPLKLREVVQSLHERWLSGDHRLV